MSVLDLGGDVRAWRLSPVRPAHVFLLNVVDQEVEEDWITALVGDACDPPDDLPTADLVYSNSVIEHVGGHWRRRRFAESARSLGRYWVQTPNRYFPVEPHFMMPWVQHLPPRAQGRLIALWPMGNYARQRNADTAMQQALDVELLSRAEMELYFPDAEIRRERAFGLTKSLVAVKRR